MCYLQRMMLIEGGRQEICGQASIHFRNGNTEF